MGGGLVLVWGLVWGRVRVSVGVSSGGGLVLVWGG